MTDQIDFATQYSPAPESTNHIEIKNRYSLFINGAFIEPTSGKYFPTINPATEKTLSEVAEADKADVDKAVKSARKAYENTWSKIPAKERGKYIYRISRMLQERSREFAVIESMDGGKPIRESRDVDTPLAAAHFFYKTNKKVGMKPAGGISDSKTAIRYLVMLKETLGKDWLTPDLFRFGASILANDILMQITKQHTGVYESADYFSKD